MPPEGTQAALTRARSTSNKKISAAAIAVVSAVNPDKPGAFLFLAVLAFFWCSLAFAQAAFHARTAMNNAIYHHSLIEVTPMLFHHLELGMTYSAVLNMVERSPVYCDSGESYCNAENGVVSQNCVYKEFIQENKTWMCHWDGTRRSGKPPSNLEVWFVGDHLTHVTAKMPNGMVYRRDSGNTIHLDRAVY